MMFYLNHFVMHIEVLNLTLFFHVFLTKIKQHLIYYKHLVDVWHSLALFLPNKLYLFLYYLPNLRSFLDLFLKIDTDVILAYVQLLWNLTLQSVVWDELLLNYLYNKFLQMSLNILVELFLTDIQMELSIHIYLNLHDILHLQ